MSKVNKEKVTFIKLLYKPKFLFFNKGLCLNKVLCVPFNKVAPLMSMPPLLKSLKWHGMVGPLPCHALKAFKPLSCMDPKDAKEDAFWVGFQWDIPFRATPLFGKGY